MVTAMSKNNAMCCGGADRVARARALRTVMFVAGLALAAIGDRAAAAYLLQPGDIVRVLVVGMAELSGAAPIDNDGMLRLPQFTPVEADGRTVEAVQEDLRLTTAGRLVRRFDAAGTPVMLSVAGSEIYLTIDQYRPITMNGAVVRPGAVPFRPGMTVRAAIAEAGGISQLQNALSTGFTGAPDALAQVRALTQERALRRAERWRHQVLIGEARIDAPPDAAALGVPEAAAASLIAAQSRLITLTMEQRATEDSFLEAAQKQINERQTILQRQAETQQGAVAADEEDLVRVQRLLERGVVPQDRLLDVRRAQVLSATRLLSTQNDQERVALDAIRIANEANSTAPERTSAGLTEIVSLDARLSDIEARLLAAKERLAMAGLDAEAMMVTAGTEPSALVHRRNGAEAEVMEIRLDELVEAGDVIEIDMRAPTP